MLMSSDGTRSLEADAVVISIQFGFFEFALSVQVELFSVIGEFWSFYLTKSY